MGQLDIFGADHETKRRTTTRVRDGGISPDRLRELLELTGCRQLAILQRGSRAIRVDGTRIVRELGLPDRAAVTELLERKILIEGEAHEFRQGAVRRVAFLLEFGTKGRQIYDRWKHLKRTTRPAA